MTLCFASGCATPGAPPEAPGHTSPTRPALSAAAEVALAEAETEINRARAAFALWTVAETAYQSALLAAAAGDSAKVIEQSRLAIELATLGLAQKAYPTTEK
jgi:hypothetical protein